MKPIALLATPILLFTACATGQNQFSSTGIGLLEDAVACAEDRIDDEGFVVTSRDADAGLMRATRGADWVQVEVIPARNDFQGNNYEISVETSDSDVARGAGQEIAVACSAGRVD